MSASYAESLVAHYQTHWKVDAVACPSPGGRTHELPPVFHVVALAPRDAREAWVYATCGMARPEDESPLELFIYSRIERESVVAILHAVAHYHRTARRLGLHHTVNFGASWATWSTCEFGLISLPYLDGPSLEWAPDALDVPVRVLWLIPITAGERAFKMAHGVEALEQRFEASGFDYLDPLRASVV